VFSFRYKDLDFSHKLDRASSPTDEYWKHMHPFNELIYFISGNVTYTVESENRQLKPGDLIFIRPGKFHFATVDKGVNYERYVFKFPDSILPSSLIQKMNSIPSFCSLANVPDNMFLILDGLLGLGNFDEEEKRILSICETLKFLVYLSKFPADDNSTKDEITSQITLYIENHLQDKLTLKEMASALSYSESYLISTFRKKMHCSIMQYVRSKKCILAYKMIRGGSKPHSVAEYLGFDEYSTFYRSYKAVLGFSPGEKNKEPQNMR